MKGLCSGYWSSSGANFSSNAWLVYFDNGNVYNDDKFYTYYVRCVRPGP